MIDAICGCGWKWTRPESAAQQSTTCPDCEKALSIACAETLPDGAGTGDFDAILDVISGPQRVGERIFLGGVAELILGKLEGSHILLPGKLVSRQHCRLTRVDFGPSKWSVTDNKSTNGLFLLSGSRINALLGNIATLIIYPVLAVGAAATHLWLGHPVQPMLGASGAIMGLAGMYLILFLVHRVFCGMWLRIWLRFRTWLFMKVFVLRGFWVLLIYAAYDAIMAWLDAGGGTAHFAHLGGFFIGAAIALGLLFSRMIYCGGGDLLNVSLGKYAWTLIGRPAQWNKSLAQEPLATT